VNVSARDVLKTFLGVYIFCLHSQSNFMYDKLHAYFALCNLYKNFESLFYWAITAYHRTACWVIFSHHRENRNCYICLWLIFINFFYRYLALINMEYWLFDYWILFLMYWCASLVVKSEHWSSMWVFLWKRLWKMLEFNYQKYV